MESGSPAASPSGPDPLRAIAPELSEINRFLRDHGQPPLRVEALSPAQSSQACDECPLGTPPGELNLLLTTADNQRHRTGAAGFRDCARRAAVEFIQKAMLSRLMATLGMQLNTVHLTEAQSRLLNRGEPIQSYVRWCTERIRESTNSDTPLDAYLTMVRVPVRHRGSVAFRLCFRGFEADIEVGRTDQIYDAGTRLLILGLAGSA
jgi:hypothetical protein